MQFVQIKQFRLHCNVFLCALSLCLTSVYVHSDEIIKYLPPLAISDRHHFEIDVLKNALNETKQKFGAYTLEIWEGEDINFTRNVREVSRGEIFNVSSNALNNEILNSDIQVIKIPIMKGLLGFRALVVHNEEIQRIKHIQTLEEFRHLKAGQIEHWSDIAVFESNNIEVVTGNNMDVLFTMLERKRFDYIPLGIGEVKNIFDLVKTDHADLSILNSTYLHYPFPVYFYVCDCEPLIAERIKFGLKTLKENGKLDQLIDRHFGGSFAKIKSQGTQIFKISNPYLKGKSGS